MRDDFLALGQQAGIRPEHLNEGVDFRLGGFLELDGVVALVGREKVVGVNCVKLRVNAIHSPNALDKASGIPRDVVVDDEVRAVQVDAFGEDFRADEDAVFVLGAKCVGVEVGDDVLADRFEGVARKEQGFAFDFVADFRGKIVGGFLGLGEDDGLAGFEQRSLFQDGPEGLPLWVAGDFLPLGADGFQGFQVVFEVGDEVRREVLGGEFFSLVLIQKPFDPILIVGFEQFKNLTDVLLADVDLAFVKLRDDALVGVDEASEGGQERGETAFEPFHREDFHELGEVALALDFVPVAVARVVRKRRIAGVFEIVRQ